MSTKSAPVLHRAVAHLQREYFDVTNPEHVKAFHMLHFGGRQHPTLRFHLEQPHLDVRTMMLDKVSEAYANQILQESATA